MYCTILYYTVFIYSFIHLNPTSGANITTLPVAGSTVCTAATIFSRSVFFSPKFGVVKSEINKYLCFMVYTCKMVLLITQTLFNSNLLQQHFVSQHEQTGDVPLVWLRLLMSTFSPVSKHSPFVLFSPFCIFFILLHFIWNQPAHTKQNNAVSTDCYDLSE